MQPYLAPSSWGDLFEASAGAAAALTGLTFVAISINVKEILEGGGIAERALATVLELLGVALVAILALMPQSRIALGIELAALGTVLTATTVVLLGYSTRRRPAGEPSYLLGGLCTTVPGLLCFALGGVSLLVVAGGGLYWVVAGILLALAGGVVSAWVLLIEILR